jgi:hypothetical protein
MREVAIRFVTVAGALAVLLGLVAVNTTDRPANSAQAVETSTANVQLVGYDPRTQPDLKRVVSDWLRKATEGKAARCGDGHAGRWNSAAKSVVRKCLWGGELLLSKNDSKIAAGVAGGALSYYVGPFLAVNAVRGLFGAAGGGGTGAAIVNSIENGRCVKLLLQYWWLPRPGLYHCT